MYGRIHFGVYELDRDALELRKHGVTIRLQEQPLQVLTALVERPGEIVTREQLQERIWGKETFVDFEQSLNKAVNRLRDALNDDPARPQYVETVPRRGYRFVAPVTRIARPEGPDPMETVNQGPDIVPPESKFRKPGFRSIAITALAASVLVALGAWAMWWKSFTRTTPGEPRHITAAGFSPALSRDGLLLAYTSTVGEGRQQLWVQQMAGGEATQVTRGPSSSEPDFSPDGTHVVFFSEKEGGGIYLAPTLAGEPRLVVRASTARFPRFSPRGDSILYWQDEKALVVLAEGGQPVPLPLNQGFHVYVPPLWSPNGKEVLFYGVRSSEQDKPAKWWIAPVDGGQPRIAELPSAERNYAQEDAVRAWVRTADEREWIVYSTSTLDTWRLLRVRVSARGQIDQSPELLASGNGMLGPGGAAATDGKLVYQIWRIDSSVYQISTTGRGQKLGPTFEALSGGGSYQSPSVSRDGKWMAYDSTDVGKPNTIFLRDLHAGVDHFLDEKGPRQRMESGETSISPDGSKVIFERDCNQGQLGADTPAPCSFAIAAVGGVPEEVCVLCTPRGFSSDGSVVLFQKYDLADSTRDRITSFNLHTRTEKDFLSDPEKPLFHAFFSWDDRWVVFKKLLSYAEEPTAQILIAPLQHGLPAQRSEWIAVTDGHYADDKPQFSPDGNTVYFTSTRDGYLCIWAQRLDPATKHPVGAPFGYEHFHNSVGRAGVLFQEQSDLSVSRDKILINLPHAQSDIWMTQMK